MLAIAGGKGGSGKTTTTLGVASALDGPVVVVDADRDMPNLHSMAGVDRRPALDDSSGAACEVGHPYPRDTSVVVVPAPARSGIDADRLSVLLSRLDADGPTLLDCPAGAGPDAAAPLRVADDVVLVTSLCGAALRDTAKTAAMARALGTRVVGVVLTRCLITPDDVENFLDCPVLGSVPDVAAPVLDSPSAMSAFDKIADKCTDKKGLI